MKHIHKLFVITLFLLGAEQVMSQTLSIQAGVGFGSFSMGDLKTLNSEFLDRFPVDAKITDDFPARLYYSGSLVLETPSPVYLGLSCSYLSSGSRISYKDFSGELRYDNTVSGYVPGLIVGADFMRKKIKFGAEANLNYALSNLKIEQEILGEKQNYKLNSNSFQVEPRVKISYPIGIFECGIKAGYLIDFGNEYSLKDEKDATLQFNNDDPVESNWSGFRFTFYTAIKFQL